MSAHGTTSLWAAAPRLQDRKTGAQAAGSSMHPAGFRHFLRDPDDTQRFAIDGVPFDPNDATQRMRAQILMAKLAGIMQFEPAPSDFNADIPSGYTYILQLIAHDIVDSSIFLSRNQGGVIGLNNVRTRPLRLETIFGGGPIECPHAYETNQSGFRDRLRLGRTRGDGERYNGKGDLRDIARARSTDVQEAYPEALIADARNDSHAILSQIVVMFHHLQRKVLENLQANANIRSTGSQIADSQRSFVATETACGLVFRRIVRDDVLRKILHPEVRSAYESGAMEVVDPPRNLENDSWLIPMEFSFGFFRFGHAMIRASYSFNPKTPAPFGRFGIADIMEHTSENSPGLMPFETIWTIDWPRFFGDDPATTNFSVKIGPWSRLDIENAVRGGERSEPGLTVRDLMGSIATRPWSIRGLVEALTKTHGELLRLSPYLASTPDNGKDPPWYAAISRWLADRRSRPGQSLDDDEIRILATDPPIPFFARFEAGLDPQIEGKHLGVLTSIVVADVFYGIFQHDRLLGIDGNLDLKQQLQEASEVIFDGAPDAFRGLESVTTIGSLIDFLGPLIKFPTAG